MRHGRKNWTDAKLSELGRLYLCVGLLIFEGLVVCECCVRSARYRKKTPKARVHCLCKRFWLSRSICPPHPLSISLSDSFGRTWYHNSNTYCTMFIFFQPPKRDYLMGTHPALIRRRRIHWVRALPELSYRRGAQGYRFCLANLI